MTNNKKPPPAPRSPRSPDLGRTMVGNIDDMGNLAVDGQQHPGSPKPSTKQSGVVNKRAAFNRTGFVPGPMAGGPAPSAAAPASPPAAHTPPGAPAPPVVSGSGFVSRNAPPAQEPEPGIPGAPRSPQLDALTTEEVEELDAVFLEVLGEPPPAAPSEPQPTIKPQQPAPVAPAAVRQPPAAVQQPPAAPAPVAPAAVHPAPVARPAAVQPAPVTPAAAPRRPITGAGGTMVADDTTSAVIPKRPITGAGGTVVADEVAPMAAPQRPITGAGGTVVADDLAPMAPVTAPQRPITGAGGTVVADENTGSFDIAAALTPSPAGPGGTVVGDEDSVATGAPGAGQVAQKEIPKQIGQYELIRELGRGGMGVVYLARDSRLGRRVAVKLLQADNPELTSRFIVEAQATAQCDHENIVVIYEVGEHEGSPFMVLEYLQGQTLADILEKSGSMQWTRVADIMVSVLRALVRAHSQGIVHRDLKPENIFLTDSGTVKVLDFGIAKVLREEAGAAEGGGSITKANARSTGMAGTLAYMSPEQWQMGGPVDHRADIWATGIILYEMLTGTHPLMDDLENFQQRVTDPSVPMPSVLEANGEIVKELAGLVDRCLAKNPDDRFPDAESLLKELEPFMPGRFRAWGNFDRGPYTGLRAFQEEDAACFFGRSAEVSSMVTRVFDYPMLAVVGPSGIGKSSLIRAGVVPALRSFGSNWRILVVRPGPQPLMALANMLLTESELLEEAGEPLTDATNLAIRFKLEPGYLGQVLRKIAQHTDSKVMLFVDQFEELYTLCEQQEQRQAFTQCLTGAADDATSPIRLLISVRADFLGRVSEDAQFMSEISKGLFFLGSPGTDGLREALVQPAEMVGYRFEDDAMVDEMVSHLQSTPGALPLLQFTAFKLWEKRDAARKMLTRQSYEALGGIGGALASHADQTVQKLSPEARAMCRALFLQLVTPERTRAVREVGELYDLVTDKEMMRQVLDEMVQSRLLVLNTGGGGGGATVEIVHESLIEAWLTLRRWLEESHEDSMFLEQLRAAARQWLNKKKDSGLLWTGEMAEELFRFRKRYKGELSDTVRLFADAVYASLVRRARLKRLATILGIGFLIFLLLAASVALVVISQAQKEAEQNEKVALKAQSQAQERLRAVQEKERARQLEEAKRMEAENQVAAANTTIDQTKGELALRNAELEKALERAEEQRGLATKAQRDAELKEKLARDAEERAKALLRREQARADRLNKQLGSPVVEVLK